MLIYKYSPRNIIHTDKTNGTYASIYMIQPVFFYAKKLKINIVISDAKNCENMSLHTDNNNAKITCTIKHCSICSTV